MRKRKTPKAGVISIRFSYSTRNKRPVTSKTTRSITDQIQLPMIPMIRPTRLTVEFFLKKADSLTKTSTTHPTIGRIKRITLITSDCSSNHLSNVIYVCSFTYYIVDLIT